MPQSPPFSPPLCTLPHVARTDPPTINSHVRLSSTTTAGPSLQRLSLFGRGRTSDREEDSDGATSRTKHFAAPTPPRFDRFQCPPRNRTTQAASARRGEIPATSCAPATSARAQDVDHEPGGVESPLTSSLRMQTLTTDRLPAGPGNPGFSAPAFSFSLPRACCRGSPSRQGLRPMNDTHPRPPNRAAFAITMAVPRVLQDGRYDSVDGRQLERLASRARRLCAARQRRSAFSAALERAANDAPSPVTMDDDELDPSGWLDSSRLRLPPVQWRSLDIVVSAHGRLEWRNEWAAVAPMYLANNVRVKPRTGDPVDRAYTQLRAARGGIAAAATARIRQRRWNVEGYLPSLIPVDPG
ncbi:hypothetical protein V8D89_000792 [Ganoderma adspersum]